MEKSTPRLVFFPRRFVYNPWPMRRFGSWVGLSLLAGTIGCYYPSVTRTRTYHPSNADLSVTRIIHGSAIIEFPETRILLDPWYNPAPPIGPRTPIGISLENLPPIRGILITHSHDDHFDRQTLSNLPDKSIRVIVRRGLGKDLREMGYVDVVELEDWERSQIGSVIVTAVPARHKVPENGYVLQAGSVTLYVAGDTRFDEKMFHEIGTRFAPLDAAMLPIGGIRILGRRLDMSPEEAAEAFSILKAGHVIPYHYELSGPLPFFTAASTPEVDFRAAVVERDKHLENAVVVLQPGESWHHFH